MERLGEQGAHAKMRFTSVTSHAQKIILRTIGCLVLSVMAVRQVDMQEVFAHTSLSLLVAIALGALLISASAWPQAKRWRLIANTFDVRLDRLPALRATLTSFFLLAVTPSTVAADSARVIALRGTGSDWTRSIHSVLIDRLVGLASVLLLGTLAIPLLLADGLSMGILIALPLSVGMLALGGGSVLLPMKLPRAWLRLRIVREWARFVRALRTTLTDRRFLLGGSLCSLLVIVLSMTAFWIIATTAGARADLVTILEVFPIALLASVIPVSVGGWGARELSVVALYPYFGTDRPIAMAVSVSFGLATVAAGVVCIAISCWIGRHRTGTSDAGGRDRQ